MDQRYHQVNIYYKFFVSTKMLLKIALVFTYWKIFYLLIEVHIKSANTRSSYSRGGMSVGAIPGIPEKIGFNFVFLLFLCDLSQYISL